MPLSLGYFLILLPSSLYKNTSSKKSKHKHVCKYMCVTTKILFLFKLFLVKKGFIPSSKNKCIPPKYRIETFSSVLFSHENKKIIIINKSHTEFYNNIFHERACDLISLFYKYTCHETFRAEENIKYAKHMSFWLGKTA